MPPLGSFFVILSLCLGLALPAGAAPPAADKAPEGARIVQALAATRPLVFSGFTRARAKLRLVSEVAGRCQKVNYDVGGTIGSKGVFAVLDDTFTRLDLKSNQVEQKRLVSRVAFLDKDAQRYRNLVKRGSEAPSKLDRLDEELTQARLQLEALKTQAAILGERLSRHVIKAPPGWRVIERRVEPGSWVAAGGQVALLGDFRTLLVPLALSPDEFAILARQAKQIKVSLPHLGVSVPAKVERLSPAFDPATRKIAVELELGPEVSYKRGGLRVELTLTAPDPSGAVLLPAGAVTERYQENWVTRVDGKSLRVVVLGPGPGGALRVSSPQIKPGQKFLLNR
ncbi:MAG: efflux RND transporter periplasmic adaptor subunit [Desulfarculaceae bacterium]|nr:efflux RND transporter periplasmic adaptor subunit [Desulfarculaceae bacterium]MCF8048801.1 efflux RND transporter periplasmic adaptor subunit [Desulfarculaceae bacterium]MCF8066053.1 efflux RND transporter periplasmic adaptor subunit [Desulfarculaceae bacterium]MCF8099696.1 efflux RND transporter periplasmic adaptor subunit [Desulfarculaceae bacterium]MCF8122196.1 efflux RND transporter periplasmic adaptor subunit [Desulfarculaceae bacterium]